MVYSNLGEVSFRWSSSVLIDLKMKLSLKFLGSCSASLMHLADFDVVVDVNALPVKYGDSNQKSMNPMCCSAMINYLEIRSKFMIISTSIAVGTKETVLAMPMMDIAITTQHVRRIRLNLPGPSSCYWSVYLSVLNCSITIAEDSIYLVDYHLISLIVMSSYKLIPTFIRTVNMDMEPMSSTEILE